MTLYSAHTDHAPAAEFATKRILVLGPAARIFAVALQKLDPSAEICSADQAADAIVHLKSGNFDHVLVDNRADGPLSLTLPALIRTNAVDNLVVLAGPSSFESVAGMHGVGVVIPTPYNPLDIARSLGIQVTKASTGSNSEIPDVSPITDTHGEMGGASADMPETEDMRPVFLQLLSALAHIIPGLTPVLSMIYKNVALTLLSALFIAFISYGVMIVYFLTSGDWSSPLQLQRGHELVIKAERERGELQVKRNLVLQQMSDAETKRKRGQNAIDRADVLAQITGSTLDQEIENKKDQQVLIEDDLRALERVLKQYGSSESRIAERRRLRSGFKKRVITRNNFQRSMLNLSEIEENIVNLRERISKKRNDMHLGSQAVAYLTQLKSKLNGSSDGHAIATGKAEFVPIANQVIEVQQVRTAGETDLEDYKNTKETLENSISVLTNSIVELDNTPMIRALKAPV
ncbi:MAG: hypothetical protein AAF412_00155, partial [Pseudomonadota bacterium]